MTNFQQLPGTVQKAKPNLKGFDTDTVITASTATYFKSEGYSFCIRYLSRTNSQQPGDISYKEANDILNSGLALSVVQHVPAFGWEPDKNLGIIYGKNAVANAVSVGLPQGINIWCDLEGVALGAPVEHVIDYCNAWYIEVKNAGYLPGLYVGANCILTGEQLYHNLYFQHYWKSLSNVPIIPNRGYQLVQSLEKELVDTISIDNNITRNDEKGSAVFWLKI